MLLINLIAARRAERRKLEIIKAVLQRGMFAAGTLTVLGVGFMTYSIQTTRNRIRDVDVQIGMLQSTVQRVNTLQADITAIQPRVATLLSAQNATNRWRAVLEEVNSSLPPKTWLTSFASQQTPPDTFVVTGQAVAHNLVGQAMLKLNQKPYLKGVDLHYTSSNSSSKVINFEVAGTMAPLEGTTDGKQ